MSILLAPKTSQWIWNVWSDGYVKETCPNVTWQLWHTERQHDGVRLPPFVSIPDNDDEHGGHTLVFQTIKHFPPSSKILAADDLFNAMECAMRRDPHWHTSKAAHFRQHPAVCLSQPRGHHTAVV